MWLGAGEFPYDPNHARETARRYSLAQFIREYQAGLLPEKSFAILSYETAKLGAGRVPAMGRKRILGLDKEGEQVREGSLHLPTMWSHRQYRV